MVTCGPGGYVVVHRPGLFDMQSEPSGGYYRALVVGFPWPVVDLARRTCSDRVRAEVNERSLFTTGRLETLRPEVEAMLDAASRHLHGTPIFQHRLLGILLALAEAGQDHFLWAGAPTLSSRIRELVASQPAFPWESHHFELRLHMSGATLRRKLAEEGSGLRDLVRDARLNHALFMLQSSGKPVKSIASACGYRSVAAFRRNFAARFGVAAAALAT
jgi:AraC-like DNA-binding protein